MSAAASPSPFALLDDREASAARPTSRLYRGYAGEHRCDDPRRLEAVWAEVEDAMRRGAHAVLLADYEWGAKLLGLAEAAAPGALRVLLFEHLERLSKPQVDAWLADEEGRDEPGPAGGTALVPSLDRAAFDEAIARIQAYIRDGETYQVNFTYRLTGLAHGTPLALYRRLRARQPVPFGAFIALPGTGGHVLSCSPELFLRGEGGRLVARPMKGTASRFFKVAPEGDSETARLLSLDLKNRAENLMIVDLLRNDLGRVARIGSVAVPELFSIESHSTVFQMTSTVEARLRDDVDFPALLRASFPCGSITGAPKHHTMELIARLESTPRGLYTGAIGWVEPAPSGTSRRCGDFCLSVAIRTVSLAPDASLTLGIGAGIVQDSVAADEFEECRLKARFLTGLHPGFELFETMRVEPDGRVLLLDRHLARLAASATSLGFAWDEEAAHAAIAARLGAAVASGEPQRLRLALSHDGALRCALAPLAPLPDGEPVGLRLEPEPFEPPALLSRHKTTVRERYDAGIRRAEAEGAFDSLFFRADGRLVEGGRSNVFVQLDDEDGNGGCRWWTPPLADGALPGVMRARLLEDPSFRAGERSLYRRDLQRARALVACNALRGALPARLVAAPVDTPREETAPT